MNKANLIDYVAGEVGVTKKDAKAAIEAVLSGVIEGLTSDAKVTLVGFGTFSLVQKAARMARNPKTGEAIDVPAKVVPKFKASAALKDLFEDAELESEDEEIEASDEPAE